MKIRPLHDRVLAKRLAGKDKTAGGLLINMGASRILDNVRFPASRQRKTDRRAAGASGVDG